MKADEDLAGLVKKARKIRGMTQVLFAAELRCAQSLVSKYERGNVEPPGGVVIHCMNIVRPSPLPQATASTADVAKLVESRLGATEYDELRSALALLIESVPAPAGKR